MTEHDEIQALAELRAELRRAASEHGQLAQRWAVIGRRQPRRRIAGSLAVAMGSIVAIAVAVVVLSAGGVRGVSSHRQQLRHATAPSSCTGVLFADLGVLRRPQTAIDRRFHPPATPPSGSSQRHAGAFPYALVPRLTRLARTLPDGQSVVLGAYAPLPGSEATRLGDLVLVFVAAPRTERLSVATEESAPFLLSAYQSPPIQVNHILLSVVRDGIARVRWTFPRVHVPRRPHLPAGYVFPGGSVTANVEENIAAAKALPRAFPTPSVATLLTPDGRVARTFHFTTPTLTGGSSSTAAMGSAVPSPC